MLWVCAPHNSYNICYNCFNCLILLQHKVIYPSVTEQGNLESTNNLNIHVLGLWGKLEYPSNNTCTHRPPGHWSDQDTNQGSTNI